MHPACVICEGSCCKFIRLKIGPVDEDTKRWLEYHALAIDESSVQLGVRCCHLQSGKCGIYENRPKVCQVFQVGSEACLYAAKRSLSPAKYERMLKSLGESS